MVSMCPHFPHQCHKVTLRWMKALIQKAQNLWPILVGRGVKWLPRGRGGEETHKRGRGKVTHKGGDSQHQLNHTNRSSLSMMWVQSYPHSEQDWESLSDLSLLDGMHCMKSEMEADSRGGGYLSNSVCSSCLLLLSGSMIFEKGCSWQNQKGDNVLTSCQYVMKM